MGKPVRGYRSPDTPAIWIRDHSDMLRGAKYWEPDMTSTVERFAETQTADGWLFDYFTMQPEKVPCERENWLKYRAGPGGSRRGIPVRQGSVPRLAGHGRPGLDEADAPRMPSGRCTTS